MKLKCNVLLEILCKMQNVVYVHFLDRRVCAYNEEILVSYPGCFDLNGSVRLKELFSLLSKLTDEELNIETTDTELRITGTKTKMEAGITLQAEISEKLQSAVKELVIDYTWKPLPKDFAGIIQQASFAAGQDMTKPLLSCVHVTSQYAESCDNYRLSRIAFPKRLQIKDMLIPARVIQNLSQYALTQCAEGNGWIHFKNADGVQFSCRMMQGQYPDLDKLLEVTGEVIDFPEGTLESLERSGIFLDDLVMGNEVCSFRLENKVLEVSARGTAGWIKEKLPIVYKRKGKSIEFQVLPKVLQSILKRHSSAVIGPRSILFKGDGFSYCCSIVVGNS